MLVYEEWVGVVTGEMDPHCPLAVGRPTLVGMGGGVYNHCIDSLPGGMRQMRRSKTGYPSNITLTTYAYTGSSHI